MKEKLNKFGHIFKKIFIVSVLILIIIEFRKISRDISLSQVKSAFEGLSLVSIVLMAIYGILANIPAVFYDFVLNKEVGNEIDKKYIGQTGFCINNFNDLLGLGGFISIGLRSAFYGRDKDSSYMVKNIMKLLLFLPTGLSFFSILALVNLKIYPDALIGNYKILLTLASLYIIGILLFLKKIDFSLDSKVSLIFISIGEWFGVISSFIVIGYLSGIEFNILRIFPLVIAANIIGYISMIPGSFGSFDLIILFALVSQGIDKEVGVLWLLLYRIFYYILPFFLASFFFAKNFDRAFSFKNEDFVKKLLKNIIIVVNSLMMYLFAIFMILSVTLPDKIYGSVILTKINPVRAEAFYQFPSLLFGFLFIIMARANISRQEKSTKINIIILSLCLVYAYITDYSFFTIAYLFIMLFFVLLTRKEMYTKQFLYASEDSFIDLLIANFMLILYVIRIIRPNLIINANFEEDFYIVPFEEGLFSIILSLSFIYLLSFLLIRYLKGDGRKIGQSFDMEKFEEFVYKNKGSKEAFLALLKDKDIYSYSEDGEVRALLQIKTVKDKIIVMGHPIGDEKYFNNLLDEFINEADLYGYNIVFYEIDKDLALKLHNYGFNFMKFGESAILDLSKFSLEGKSRKNLRKTVNKLTRLGLEFEVLEGPHNEKTLNELEEISEAWLDGKKEKGFSLGFFDKDYLNKSDIAVVKDENGEIFAFANLAQTYLEDWSTVDLMRYKKNYDGLMDYLFINIFSYYKERQVKYFDLGMAPFYNVGTMKHSFLQEKLVYFAYKLGSNIYSFEGLKTYKSKYADFWDERYLSYSKGSNLFFSSLSLLYAINKR